MDRISSLTTGQAADCYRVSPATIVNCIRKGELKVYVKPGGHGGIVLVGFLSYCSKHGIAVHSVLVESFRPSSVLIDVSLMRFSY